MTGMWAVPNLLWSERLCPLDLLDSGLTYDRSSLSCMPIASALHTGS